MGKIIKNGIEYTGKTIFNINNFPTATDEYNGLMSKEDKIKLDNFNLTEIITDITDTMIIDALGYTPSRTDTTYSDFIGSGSNAASGLVPAPSTTQSNNKYLCEDGTWRIPPNANTTYSQATPDEFGLVKVGYSSNDENYAVDLDTDGKMYVHVPLNDYIAENEENFSKKYALKSSLNNYTTTENLEKNYLKKSMCKNINNSDDELYFSGSVQKFEWSAVTGDIDEQIDTTILLLDGEHGNIYIRGYIGGVSDLGYDIENHAIRLGADGRDYCEFLEYGGDFRFYKRIDSNTRSLIAQITENGFKLNSKNCLENELENDENNYRKINIETNINNDNVICITDYIEKENYICKITGEHINFNNEHDSVIGSYSAGNIFSNDYIGITLRDKNSSNFYYYFFEKNNFSPSSATNYDLGTLSHKWNNIYAKTSTIQTSDRNQKKDIQKLPNNITKEFIKGLNPVSYKFIENQSNRTHYGLIAQDVEELLEKLNLTSQDFAGFIKSPKTETMIKDENGNELETPQEKIIEGEYDYGLRYEEFIAPLIKVVQEQQKEIDELREIILNR